MSTVLINLSDSLNNHTQLPTYGNKLLGEGNDIFFFLPHLLISSVMRVTNIISYLFDEQGDHLITISTYIFSVPWMGSF